MEEPPNQELTEDLQPALKLLRVKREQEEWEREGARGTSGEMSENEDGGPADSRERGWSLRASGELVPSPLRRRCSLS